MKTVKLKNWQLAWIEAVTDPIGYYSEGTFIPIGFHAEKTAGNEESDLRVTLNVIHIRDEKHKIIGYETRLSDAVGEISHEVYLAEDKGEALAAYDKLVKKHNLHTW